MRSRYEIRLNFLPLVGELPDFEIYRRVAGDPQENRPEGDDVRRYSLPDENGAEAQRHQYWVSFAPVVSLEKAKVTASANNHLTLWVIFKSLAEACARSLAPDSYWASRGGFQREVHFNMREHAEGWEQLIVQPYLLHISNTFGLLADFHFRKHPEAPFSRRIQQLSLSLNERFNRNLDCYVDRVAKIAGFLHERRNILSFELPGTRKEISFSEKYESLAATRLRPKSYVFKDDRESRSQFSGLKDYGPLKALDGNPTLRFVFRERDRQAARTLAAAIKGSAQRVRYSFPGFEQLFKVPISIDANPIVLTDFSTESMRDALARIQADNAPLCIPVVILPDGDEASYLTHKAVFSHAGVPTQVCTLGVIQDQNTLKWSVANIALQIFCKAGGIPWKVRAAGERTLIIGISQSHKLSPLGANNKIEKYFAFSILTDSSGLFQKIQVLSESPEEETYLDQLRSQLTAELRDGANEFSRVVVHTSFKLKQKEIDQVQKAVEEVASTHNNQIVCRFAVAKVNQHSRFFGANPDVNSLVPYEGSVVKLGAGEYLVWFEGIFPDKPTVTKAFPGPTHIHFLRVPEGTEIIDEILLQDLVNLSGANWRGFNAKSAPVSVFYCHLVADLVHDFQERNLPLPAIEDLRPWFL
jgi:hypothetical protein